MQLYNYGENARSYPGLISWTTNEHFFCFQSVIFLVSILTSSPQLSCHSASACHISPISDHSRRRYDVIDF